MKRVNKRILLISIAVFIAGGFSIFLFYTKKSIREQVVKPGIKTKKEEQQGYKPVLSSDQNISRAANTNSARKSKALLKKDSPKQKTKINNHQNTQAKNIYELNSSDMRRIEEKYYSLPQEDKKLNLYPDPERLKEIKKKKLIIY